MRAVRWHARGDVRCEDVAPPGDPGPDDVVLSVLLCGVCGTDLDECRIGPINVPATAPHPLTGAIAPLTLGHEVLGRVVAVGSAVSGLAVGDRVVPDGVHTCGACVCCLAGQRSLCVRQASIGLQRDGGMAEFLRVPAAMCIRVPEGVPDRQAVLAEPLAVAVRAVRRAALVSGERVLVVGAGTIGQCVIQLAQTHDVAVGVVDLDESRVAGTRMVAPDVVPAPPHADHPWVGEADCVIDCAGSPRSLEYAVDAVRPAGRVMLVAAATTAPTFSPHTMLLKELTVMTSLSHDIDQDTRPAIELLATGALRLDHVVTDVVSLDAVGTSVLMADAGPGRGRFKTVVDPSIGRSERGA